MRLRLKPYRLLVVGAPRRYLVDLIFAKRLVKYSWRYVKRNDKAQATIKTGKPRVRLHRLVARYAGIRWQEMFFANNDPFDCRMANLVPYRRDEEGARRKTYKNKTVPYKGVHLKKGTGKFGASLRHHGKLHYLGYFMTPELAAQAYRKAYKEAHPNAPEIF